MSERTRSRERPGDPAPAPTFDSADPGSTPGNATVASGPYAETLPVSGMSIESVRRRLGDRFDLAPDSQAFLDGEEASEDTVVRDGQLLLFARRSGEKGAAAGASEDAVTPRMVAEDRTLAIETPEGEHVIEPLAQALEDCAPRRQGTGSWILPEGVRSVVPFGRGVTLVHETPPHVRSLRWISAESKQRFGPEAEYREVRLSLPYVVLLAVFEEGARGDLVLSNDNEAFFRNAPLRSLQDELCYPSLLNCSKVGAGSTRPMAWVCTQYLGMRERHGLQPGQELAEALADCGGALRRALAALHQHLFDSGFNESSEHHELSSWFSETVKAGVDPRLASVESWQEATLADPAFACEVEWLPTGRTLEQTLERCASRHGGPARAPRDVADVLRRVQQARRRRSNEKRRGRSPRAKSQAAQAAQAAQEASVGAGEVS